MGFDIVIAKANENYLRLLLIVRRHIKASINTYQILEKVMCKDTNILEHIFTVTKSNLGHFTVDIR